MENELIAIISDDQLQDARIKTIKLVSKLRSLGSYLDTKQYLIVSTTDEGKG